MSSCMIGVPLYQVLDILHLLTVCHVMLTVLFWVQMVALQHKQRHHLVRLLCQITQAFAQ